MKLISWLICFALVAMLHIESTVGVKTIRYSLYFIDATEYLIRMGYRLSNHRTIQAMAVAVAPAAEVPVAVEVFAVDAAHWPLSQQKRLQT